MASADHSMILAEEVTCSICFEYLREPLITQCGHNFCTPCINQCWAGVDTNFACPQCRAISQEKILRPNRKLECMVNIVQQINKPKKEDSWCDKHAIDVTLYCQDDGVFLCTICKQSDVHNSHIVLPIHEAAQASKEKIKSQRIMSEVDWLIAMLQDEKNKLLNSMQEDLENVVQENLGKKEQHLPLAGLIHELEIRCQQSPVELLKDVKSILSRCDEMKIGDDIQEPLSSGAVNQLEDLCNRHSILHENIAKWTAALPTEFKWRIHRQFARDVSLDPYTAHPQLYLSLDRKSVRFGDVWQVVLDTPQRYDTWNAVLGLEKFTFGRHYWEVEVGSGKIWSVGVCNEAVDRMGLNMRTPENGYWEVGLWNGDYWALANPPPGIRLSPELPPKTVGIYLNYENGRVTFYNVEARTELFTFNECHFTCTLRPSFCTGSRDPPMRIRPLEEQE
ncbi:E3 ubiquitin-protein ligase TRIM39-like isoform X2 [Ambystoma mexicanum]|uniref:E3 ubiquitin-protein ligase TRIM39-like isoform X2 n=1 Tax=Ambystoma mexicanum TaxID=8296 RepID=UPI0037E96BE5